MIFAIEAAVTPLPTEEITPQATKIYFIKKETADKKTQKEFPAHHVRSFLRE